MPQFIRAKRKNMVFKDIQQSNSSQAVLNHVAMQLTMKAGAQPETSSIGPATSTQRGELTSIEQLTYCSNLNIPSNL